MKEVWKPVAGHEDHYEVSNLGNVRSLSGVVKRGCGYYFKNGRVLKQLANNHGYMYVYLRFGVCKKSYVHRLVAEAFFPNRDPNANTVVNHIDFNPKNNRADNLEWTTDKGNVQHSLRAGRYERTDAWLSHLREYNEKNGKAVIGRSVFTGEEITFKCLNDCREAGFQPSCVCNCCQGKRRSHKGYTWRYADA